MNRYAIFAAALTMAFVISAPVRAEEICELPSDIDEGERYVIKFKGVKEKRFKIVELLENAAVRGDIGRNEVNLAPPIYNLRRRWSPFYEETSGQP